MTQTGSPPEWMTFEEVAGRWRVYRPEVDELMLKQRPPEKTRVKTNVAIKAA